MDAQGVLDDLAGGDTCWVMGDGGHADAAVEEAEFVAFESAGCAAVVGIEGAV